MNFSPTKISFIGQMLPIFLGSILGCFIAAMLAPPKSPISLLGMIIGGVLGAVWSLNSFRLHVKNLEVNATLCRRAMVTAAISIIVGPIMGIMIGTFIEVDAQDRSRFQYSFLVLGACAGGAIALGLVTQTILLRWMHHEK